MPEPELRYHQATFDLIGEKPVITAESLAAVEAWEQDEGRRLPAALREWYSLANGPELLARYSNADRPEPLAPRHRVCRAIWKEDPEEPPQPRLWVLQPQAREWEEFTILEELDDPGYLEFITENQGVVTWYVHLDGADPPVYDDQDGQPLPGWHKNSDTLSSFICDWFCYYRYPNSLGPAESHVVVAAEARLPTQHELEQLRGHFREGPRTPEAARGWRYRFFTAEACLLIGLNTEGDPPGEAYWQVAATSDDALSQVLRLLWPVADFGEKVRPYFLLDDRAERILTRLGWVKDRGIRDARWYWEQAKTLRLQSMTEQSPELLQQAIEAANQGIELDPDHAGLYKERIFCYESIDDYAGMISDYTRLMELRPEELCWWLIQRFECYRRLQQFDQAADDLCAAIAADPDYSSYQDNAEWFSRVGREDLMLRVYECWRAHPPKFGWMRRHIDEFFARRVAAN